MRTGGITPVIEVDKRRALNEISAVQKEQIGRFRACFLEERRQARRSASRIFTGNKVIRNQSAVHIGCMHDTNGAILTRAATGSNEAKRQQYAAYEAKVSHRLADFTTGSYRIVYQHYTNGIRFPILGSNNHPLRLYTHHLAGR